MVFNQQMLKMAALYATKRFCVFKKRLNFLLHKRYYAQSNWGKYAEVEINLGEQKLKLSTGELARSAGGAVVAKLGRTTVLATATCQKQSGYHSFLPLTVDYRQAGDAARRIPTNYFECESNNINLLPMEKQILTSRIIDRSVRPLFPPGFRYSTKLLWYLMGMDGTHDLDVININAASAALAISDIPWNGPVAAARVGILGEDVIINPTRKELHKSSLNIVLTGTTQRKVVMVEGEADRVDLHKVEQALSKALEATEGIIEKITALQTAVGKPKREFVPLHEPPQQVADAVQSFALNQVRDILFNKDHDEIRIVKALEAVRGPVVRNVKDSLPDEEEGVISSYYQVFVKKVLRDMILDEDRRCDGRGLSDLRNISCAVDLYETQHGSAMFRRGQTEVVCKVIFNSLGSAVWSDLISILNGGVTANKFVLHYWFPLIATHETGRGGIGRELGHGALAEREYLYDSESEDLEYDGALAEREYLYDSESEDLEYDGALAEREYLYDSESEDLEYDGALAEREYLYDSESEDLEYDGALAEREYLYDSESEDLEYDGALAERSYFYDSESEDQYNGALAEEGFIYEDSKSEESEDLDFDVFIPEDSVFAEPRSRVVDGVLAERGLRAILPAYSKFTTRLIARDQGFSYSCPMSSVCSGSLALMDAGVQVKEPAAGVTMGLVTRPDPTTGNITDHKILTDLMSFEENMSDMDFNMAATKTGLTALRAEIRLPGIPLFVVVKALETGFVAIKQTLEIMSQTMSSPRKSLKPCAPVTGRLVLDPAKQSQLVGKDGDNLYKLKSYIGVAVTRIDEASFQIFAADIDAMVKAKEMIEQILQEQVYITTDNIGEIVE